MDYVEILTEDNLLVVGLYSINILKINSEKSYLLRSLGIAKPTIIFKEFIYTTEK